MEIYLISKNPENHTNKLKLELILKSKNLSKVFFTFLRKNCQYFIPQAIAASSEINSREFDGGKIISQKSFYILSNFNEFDLKKKTQSLEYFAYPEALIKIFRANF